MKLYENSTIHFLVLTVLSPILGLLINLIFFKRNIRLGARIASFSIWIGLITALIAWATKLPFSEKNASLGFATNELSWLMATLILFVSGVVHHFSLRYMEGDRKYRSYFLYLSLITTSTLLMVASDNLLILIPFWFLSNTILVLLMMHKGEWRAARNSSSLAMKTFILGLLFLTAGAGILAYESGTLSLQLIVENSETLSTSKRETALLFIVLAAFSQSGCWPFHKWLISSLNSPTPVSGFMHAGLVNGGGLLLARFAPVLLQESLLLNILCLLAVISLILGGIWKLIQSNIKRMLACSTMTQMGFMLMQCGLGLFPSALAHLFWHGLFKAFHFLKSGSTITENRHINNEKTSSFVVFFLSSISGLAGAIGFCVGSDQPLNLSDTTSILIFFAWMTSTQIAHTLLQKKRSLVFSAITLCLATGILYGLTVNLIEIAVAPLQISQAQPLNTLHLICISLIFCIWIGLNLTPFKNYEGSLWWRSFYVRILNSSQPNPETVTSSRNGYKF